MFLFYLEQPSVKIKKTSRNYKISKFGALLMKPHVKALKNIAHKPEKEVM